MEIYVMSVGAGGSGEIFVTFEMREGTMRDTSKFLISDAAYIELAISKGQCSSLLYDTVEREAQIYAAYKKALYMLGFSSSIRYSSPFTTGNSKSSKRTRFSNINLTSIRFFAIHFIVVVYIIPLFFNLANRF